MSISFLCWAAFTAILAEDVAEQSLADVIRIESPGLVLQYRLKDQIEGRRLKIPLKFENATGDSFRAIEFKTNCKCIQAAIKEQLLEPRSTAVIDVVILPGRDAINDQLEISAEVNGNRIAVASLRFKAKCYPPVRLDRYFHSFNDEDLASVELIPGDASIAIDDLKSIQIASEYLEVKNVERLETSYKAYIGPREGVTLPEKTIGGYITGTFVVSGKKMPMNEYCAFLSDTRLEVSPKVLRFKATGNVISSKFTCWARAIVRDSSGEKGKLHAVMVAREGDSVVMIDSDAMNGFFGPSV